MNIRELFQECRVKMGPDGDHLGAELLLAFVLGKDRAYLLAHADEVIAAEVLGRFYDLFGRMMAGEPVAYLLGKREFYGLDFFVDRRVLIPRPETEHLVEKILSYHRPLPLKDGTSAHLRILDVGTGSGCIAIVLAKHLPSAQVTGVDISEEALEVAKKNAEMHGVSERVKFFQSDLLASVQGPFDVVVANLPYIGEKRFSFVSKSAVDYEPHVALFGGDDGLGLYRKFFEQLAARSWRPRLLLGEFGFLQRDELESLFGACFSNVSLGFEQDYAHIDRMFVVEFP